MSMAAASRLDGFQGRLPRVRAVQGGDTREERSLRVELQAAKDRIAELEALVLQQRPTTARASVVSFLRHVMQTEEIAGARCDAEIAAILETVERESGIPAVLICGPLRHPPFVAARTLFVGLAREAGYTYVKIGMALGFRDHCTVMNLAARGRAMVAARAAKATAI